MCNTRSRWIVYLFAFFILATIISFSDSKAYAKTSPTEIVIWHSLPEKQAAIFNGMVNQYVATTSGMVVCKKVAFNSPEELHKKLLEGEERPDIALIDTRWLSAIASKNELECVEDAILQGFGNTVFLTFKSDTFTPMWESSKYKGKLYAVPFYGYNRALILNRDLFNQFSIKLSPKSWYELVEIGKIVAGKVPPSKGGEQIWAFSIPADGDPLAISEFFQVFLWQLGRDISEPFLDGELSGFDGSEGKAILNMMVEMVNLHKMASTHNVSKDKLAMFIGTPEDYITLKQSGKNVEVFAWPGKSKSKNDLVVYSFIFFKTNDAGKKEKIVHLIYELCEFKSILKWATQTPYLPTDKQVTLSPNYFSYTKQYPGLNIFLQQLKNSQVNAMDERKLKIMNILGSNLKVALEKKMSVDDCLKVAATEADAILDPTGRLRKKKAAYKDLEEMVKKIWDKDYSLLAGQK